MNSFATYRLIDQKGKGYGSLLAFVSNLDKDSFLPSVVKKKVGLKAMIWLLTWGEE